MPVSAIDLDRWAESNDARNRTPQLVRRLIMATTDLESIEFRANEAVNFPGWDGQVESPVGNLMVPTGTSLWEITTASGVKGAAQENYTKRTEKPLGHVPADSTFVFVTPRIWRDKEDWVTERKKEGVWSDVRALDATNLETWLEEAPGVAIWFAPTVNQAFQHVQDLERSWGAWSKATSPPLSTALAIGGRTQQAEAVFEWISGPSRLLTLQAETTAEAIAFFNAVVESLPEEERERVRSRGVVVKEDDGWAPLATFHRPLLLVADGISRAELHTAPEEGHHVLVPLARNEVEDHRTVTLPSVETKAAREALADMGVPNDDLDELSGLAWRGLEVLRRRLADHPATLTPPWADAQRARALVPALLAGQWQDDVQGDRTIVEALAGEPYAAYRARLDVIRNQPDPPIRLTGSMWHLVARTDSWYLVARRLGAPDLDALVEPALKVLREQHPKFSLPPEDRFAAAAHGAVAVYSGDLRRGIAETIAYLAASGTGSNIGAYTAGQRASVLVREALADASWERWGTLGWSCSDLAEASPDDFMSAVEKTVLANPPALQELFKQAGGGPFAPDRPGEGILQAMRTLEYDPAHLKRAAEILATIALESGEIP